MPLLAVGLMCAQPLSSISGWVETASGDRLKHVMLRINNAGGKETTDTGEFSMPLPSGLGPGDPVVFYVDEYIVQDR